MELNRKEEDFETEREGR